MGEVKHTALPWKVVSAPHFDSGLVYTSVQPVNVDEEGMKPLAMANGEFHVCRMSHTAAPWRFNYHRANADFIVTACNSYYGNQAQIAKLREENDRLREALKPFRKVAGYLFERNYGASDIVLDMTLERKGKGIFLRAGDFFPVAATLKEPTP